MRNKKNPFSTHSIKWKNKIVNVGVHHTNEIKIRMKSKDKSLHVHCNSGRVKGNLTVENILLFLGTDCFPIVFIRRQGIFRKNLR